MLDEYKNASKPVIYVQRHVITVRLRVSTKRIWR